MNEKTDQKIRKMVKEISLTCDHRDKTYLMLIEATGTLAISLNGYRDTMSRMILKAMTQNKVFAHAVKDAINLYVDEMKKEQGAGGM